MRVPAVVLLLGLLLAGCAPSSTNPTARPAASEATRSGAATSRPSAMPMSHAAPDLEALLPAKVGNATLTRGSATGANVFGDDPWSKTMSGFLTQVGKTPADFSYATAADQSQSIDLELGAFRVAGVPAASLATAIVEATKPGAPGLTTGSTKIGSREVTTMTYASGSTVYLYPHDGIVFYVGTADPNLATQVLDLLP